MKNRFQKDRNKGFFANSFLGLILFSFLICCSSTCNSQIDSLKQVLKIAKEDSNKVKALNELGWQLYLVGQHDTALNVTQQALSFAKRLKIKREEARAYNNIGNIHSDMGNYAKALDNQFVALKIQEEMGDKKGMANSYGNIGIVYDLQNKYQEAMLMQTKAIDLYNEIGDKNGLINAYNNKGIIYRELGNYPEALKQYFTSLKIAEELGDKRGTANAHNNIGRVCEKQNNISDAIIHFLKCLKIYKEIGDKRRAAYASINIGIIYEDQDKYDEALKLYSDAFKAFEEIKDKSGMASAITNIGFAYYNQHKFKEALEQYFVSLKIMQEIDEKAGIIFNWTGIGNCYKELKDYDTSVKYFTQALDLATQIEDPEGSKEANHCLSEVYALMGKHKEALQHYKQYVVAKDSLINEESIKKTEQAKMQYEYEKKEAIAQREVIIKEQAQKLRNIITLIIIFFLAIALCFIAVLALSKIKRVLKEKRIVETINSEQASEIESLKEQLLNQLATIRENNTRFQELVAQNDETVVNKETEELVLDEGTGTDELTIDEELTKEPVDKNNHTQLLSEFNLTQKEQWNDFRNSFNRIYPEFEERIVAKVGAVSKAELRLLMLHKLGLNNKDIAQTLLITADGVKKAKYRIYKKVGVGSSEELSEFLN